MWCVRLKRNKSGRWLRSLGVSLSSASVVALLPTMVVHFWASSAYHAGGGDFSGFGFGLEPLVFYPIWLLALPISFLIAITSPALHRLGYNTSRGNSRHV